MRFDQEEAQTLITSESTDGEALFFRDPVGIIADMLQHDEMVFGFTPFNASPVVTTFDLRGLAEVIQPLQGACDLRSFAPTQSPTPWLVVTDTPTVTPTPLPVGSYLVVENWRIQIERIETAQSITFNDKVEIASGRFALLFMSVTNLGLSPDTFVSIGTIEIQDASGQRYMADTMTTMYAEFQYDTDISAGINPNATKHVVAVFDISEESDSYLLVPGTLAPPNEARVLLDIP